MERYRAGYERDYGLRDFDNRRPRYDVGSRGYDRGYYRGGRGGAYERPWVGGYHEGYQGGSGGIGVNTSGTGGAYLRGEGTPWRQGNPGYGRDYDTGGYHPGRGDYGIHGSRESGRERGGFDRGYGRRRGYDGGWFNEWSRWF